MLNNAHFSKLSRGSNGKQHALFSVISLKPSLSFPFDPEWLWQHRRGVLAQPGSHLQIRKAGGLQAPGGDGGLDGQEGLRSVQQLSPGAGERGLPPAARHLPGQRWGFTQQPQRQTIHHLGPGQRRLLW